MSRHWKLDTAPDLEGKTAIITGANSGIGFEAALAMAKKGAEVVLACRSLERGEKALELVRSVKSGAKAKLMQLDLASLKSVRGFADRFRSEHGRLDFLINNAGLMAVPLARTEDGFEMQLGTNHLGHFALTGLLFGRLIESDGARVVNVSSHMHRAGRINFDDLNSERRYDRWAAYSQSKLANMLFTHELQRRANEKLGKGRVRVTAAHPGYTATALQGKSGSKIETFIMRIGNGVVAQTAAMGALPTLRAALDPDIEGGEYFGPGGPFELAGHPVPVQCTPAGRHPETAKQLWAESVRLTGVDFGGL